MFDMNLHFINRDDTYLFSRSGLMAGTCTRRWQIKIDKVRHILYGTALQ